MAGTLNIKGADLRRRYQHDGIVFPIRVLSPEQALAYRRACDELEAHLGGKPRTIEVRQMHLHFRWAYDLVTQPNILDAVESVLGPDLLIWATELFAKHPQDASVAIGWHRDQPYMGFDADDTVTAWVALSDSTEANGCMCYAPGTGGANFGSPEEVESAPAAKTVPVLLKAGEMSLHDVYVIHGSKPNLSTEKRVGFAIRFVTPEARPRQGRPPAVLARGSDACHHVQLVDPPEETDIASALAALKTSAAHHLDAMLGNLKAEKVSGTFSDRKESFA